MGDSRHARRAIKLGRIMRQIVSAALWAYFGWYLAAHITSVFGLPNEIAPIGGLLMLAIAMVNRRWFRDRQSGAAERVPFA